MRTSVSVRARLGAGAERKFIESLAAVEITVERITLPDLRRCAVLLEEYELVGFVDASVVAVAERPRLHTIATTNRRHFARIRPKHVPALQLVP